MIFDTEFEKSFKKLLKDEGVYSNDPVDSGGETVYGISRVHHPDEKDIWDLVDSQKINSSFPKNLKNNTLLLSFVKDFYYNNYYKKNNIDKMPVALREKSFSMVVNMGRKGLVILQKAYNIKHTGIGGNKILVEDGVIGKNTLKMLNKEKDIKLLMTFYKAECYVYYRELCERHPKNNKFIRGWAKRAFS